MQSFQLNIAMACSSYLYSWSQLVGANYVCSCSLTESISEYRLVYLRVNKATERILWSMALLKSGQIERQNDPFPGWYELFLTLTVHIDCQSMATVDLHAANG